jgi:hypothetical protein
MPINGRKQSPARTDGGSDWHPIPVGTCVTILRVSRAGVSIEGRAVIREIAPKPHTYLVQFIADPVLRERVVHLEYQRDQRMLEILRDLWRASSTPALPDFFPDENT